MGLGYGVVNAPVMASCAAWFGSYSLTFGIVLLGAGLAFSRGIVPRAALLAAWAVLLCVPASIPAPSHPLKARLVQAGAEETETMLRLSRAAPGHDEQDSRPRANPADVIVWPEYSFVRDPMRDRKTWRRLEQAAQDNRAVLVFGGEDQSGFTDLRQYRNTAFALGPDGRLLGRHVKNHPVHFFNDGEPGTEARAIPSPAGRLGVAICFDMDYPDVARRLAADGAEVFIVPNMDPVEWGPVQRAQHRLMFQMRAVECGRWLARADVAGGTSVAAPDGRETARVGTSGPTVLEACIGREAGQTLFVRWGWRFPQACLLALVLLCLWALLRRQVISSGPAV
jgi:apolipoprotein N-acyltransferase